MGAVILSAPCYGTVMIEACIPKSHIKFQEGTATAAWEPDHAAGCDVNFTADTAGASFLFGSISHDVRAADTCQNLTFV